MKTKMVAVKKNLAPRSRHARVKKIIDRLEAVHPDARLDLDFTNPLELLIALILAAQARDDLVRQITPGLFKKHQTPQDYAKASLPELEKDIRKLNFYHNKAKAIHNCCNELVKRFDGKVPNNLEDLLSLPGVGRKTANIVLGNAFGQDTIGVDTHVMRLAQRLELSDKSDPDKIEEDLTLIVPKTRRVRFCHLLQYHGRRICIAKKPKCRECTISGLCRYPAKTDV
jgi:endonuclease-3